MKSCVLCLQVYLLLLTWGLTYGSGDITCTATTDLTQSTVTCYFHDDLSKIKNNFNVQFYFPPKTTNPDQQLACNWLLTGPTQCSESQGVQFNNNVTDQLTFTAPPMVDKVGGEYMCHVLTLDDVTVHPCTLIFNGGARTVTKAETDAEASSNSYGQVQTLARIAVGLSAVALILILALLVFLLCKYKSRICSRSRYETNAAKMIESPHVCEVAVLLPGDKTGESVAVAGNDLDGSGITVESEHPVRTERQPGSANPSVLNVLGQPTITTTVTPQQCQEETEVTLDPPSKEQRILIIGKQKSGKSSLANTITDSQYFRVGNVYSMTTWEPSELSATRFNKTLKVVDTPDLSQINNMADKRRQVAKWKQMTSPGPSAILVAIPCDTRFKQVDYAAYEEVKNLWGDDSSFCGRLFIVFTYADRESRGMKKEAWYQNPELKKVLADAQYQHTKINNKASAEEKQSVVEGILLTVDEIENREALKI